MKKFNTKTQKLVPRSQIKFVNFCRNYINLHNGTQIPLVPVLYKGEMRFAIEK